MKLTYSALLLVLPVSLAFEVPSLTPDNYDELTEGKTVFIKFFAPWVSGTSEHWSAMSTFLVESCSTA